MGSIAQILLLLLDVAWYIVLAHIIMSWLLNFNVLNYHQPIVAQIWRGLNSILAPVYRPIRRLLPNTGGLDFTPLVVILIIMSLRIIIVQNFGYIR